MELQEVIRRRRMVREFDSRPVPAEVLERILSNAVRAPSAGFSQGWAFVVLEGPDETALFWDMTTDPAWSVSKVSSAPVIVLPLSHKQAYLDRYSRPDKAGFGMDREEGWPVPYWDVDCAFACMLMLLSAVDAGLGALFFGIFRGEQELLAALGVPEGYRPIGALALGYPAPGSAPSQPSLKTGRRPLGEVVHRRRWQEAPR